MTQTLYTIGHSTHPAADFIALLRRHDIRVLADVRTIPKSRHNPQYGQAALKRSLEDSDMAYEYMAALGGLRRARADSPNGGWRNASFRGYADYMQTDEFTDALSRLIVLGCEKRTAIMCAESVPWRCHRSLIADALTVRDIPVMHIMPDGKASPHKLTPFARVADQTILYPPEAPELPGLQV